jgi:ATP/maltotriose-dependent transcriptional regulator MalT
MTDQTAKFHLKNIFRKLGVDNRIAAINAARELDPIQEAPSGDGLA